MSAEHPISALDAAISLYGFCAAGEAVGGQHGANRPDERRGNELKGIKDTRLTLNNTKVISALEIRNIIDVVCMILGSASLRKESRGPHLFFENSYAKELMKRDDINWKNTLRFLIKNDFKDNTSL